MAEVSTDRAWLWGEVLSYVVGAEQLGEHASGRVTGSTDPAAIAGPLDELEAA